MQANELYSLIDLVKYCNSIHKQKRTGKEFTFSDIQQYIKTGHFPYYLGGENIVKVEGYKIKLYRIEPKYQLNTSQWQNTIVI